MIDGCSFGKVVVNGEPYTSDLIIYPEGRIEEPWYRKSGHRLCADDIRDLIYCAPDVIVAGTGVSGRVVPDRGLARALSEKGITFIALPNHEAMERYNALEKTRRVGACFHLTC
jgi:hypothetical protein